MSEALCPYFEEPCKKHQCVSWQSGPVERDGQVQLIFECVQFFWIPLYLKGIANRADGTQQAVEKLRNEVHSGNEAVGLFLSHRQQAQLPQAREQLLEK